ncbi:DUF1365 domain-containing protein [Rhodococcus sp. USK10]|uniref:DUF1365 domain-containing protein n=1 Tax=Rhodococcus TaxID=1827 RepID=UPI001C49353D|nr:MULTISPECIES: DUF1365 domain-containing protein [Rhodococcus]MBV6762371.1 DUF1365 domain-containing protein [Rhodococcus opacus]QYB06564.1 DUF1365 domain-containing protein [Rhodococcus sp. USK10]
MTAPAIYSTRIRHARTEPVRNSFEYASYSWYVDVDALPRLPRWLGPFARFRAEDHFEPDPAAAADTLRSRVDAFLAGHGVDLRGGRVTALVNARVLGYVFNPLSVYWCHDADGSLRCVIAEVHNTYGQRHGYLIRPDGDDRAEVDKQFYVSPFNDVSGRYDMRFPEPGDTLSLNVVLHRDGHGPFTATVRGTRQPATSRTVLRTQLRTPLAPLVVSARIRIQGITLWARGLPVMARPDGRQKETVQ